MGAVVRTIFLGLAQASREATIKQFPGRSTCLQGDIESLPFESGLFDGAILAGVLSHQLSNHNSVNEIGRIVKKDGIILVTLPNIFKLRNLLDLYYYLILSSRLIGKIFSSRQKSKPGIKEFVRYNPVLRKYYYGQLNGLFRVNGLAVKETVSCGFGPFTFWKKEIFPFGWSMKLSSFLEKLTAIKVFGFLKILANSWVIRLEKIR